MKRDSCFGDIGRRYFSRPPLRSYHFWVSTLLLLIVVCEALYYVVRLGSRLDGEARLSMIFPSVVVTVLWIRVWIAHRDVYQTYHSPENAREKENEPGTERLLNHLAYLLYAGFGLALFALGSLYVAAAHAITEVMSR